MLKAIFTSLIICFSFQIKAQYAPAAGQTGSTAIYKDSSIINNWALACNVERGWINIADTILGKATNGITDNALGIADNSTISLGDGGVATLTFIYPIIDGPSWDFVIFENAFDDFFLELAFVEVSSDGVNYFRFPAHSLTQTDTQVGGFGQLNTSKINNLAGKYKGGYGTPFDLSELPTYAGLDIYHITYIRIIDVVGSIDTAYGTTDTAGNMINDPFPTPFASSGFDLDAVGVIHQMVGFEDINKTDKNIINIYPNPANNYININTLQKGKLLIFSQIGNIVYEGFAEKGTNKIDISNLSSGIYLIKVNGEIGKFLKYER